MKGFTIDTREIPEDGRQISGEISAGVFGLGEKDTVRPAGPVRYDCHISRVTGTLLAMGSFEAAFELQCVRCLEWFPFPVKMDHHALEEALENKPIIDLTNTLREDILLALPAYPRCDEGPQARECPAQGRFDKEDEFQPVSEEEANAGRDVWGALDELDTPPEKN